MRRPPFALRPDAASVPVHPRARRGGRQETMDAPGDMRRRICGAADDAIDRQSETANGFEPVPRPHGVAPA